jgi:hypothetical protein
MGDAIKSEWFIPGRATLESGSGFCHQRGVVAGWIEPGK